MKKINKCPVPPTLVGQGCTEFDIAMMNIAMLINQSGCSEDYQKAINGWLKKVVDLYHEK